MHVHVQTSTRMRVLVHTHTPQLTPSCCSCSELETSRLVHMSVQNIPKLHRACMRMPFELSERHVEGHHNRIIAVTERIAEAIEVVDHSVREADKQLVPVIACWVP